MSIIRRVVLADLPVVSKLVVTALTPYYVGDHHDYAKCIVDRAISDVGHDEFSLHVAVEDGGVVGLIGFEIKACSILKISPLIVAEDYRRRSIGSSLLDGFDNCGHLSLSSFYTTVDPKNKKTIDFFIKKGFAKVGATASYTEDLFNEVILHKIR